MQPQAVIFDIGNVLIGWQPERFFDREIGAERRRALFEAGDLLAKNDAVDLGAHFSETFHGAADACPDWRDEILMWHDRWIEMASPAFPRSVRLLRALRRKGIPVFALSNFGVQTFEIACAHYPFLTEFDRRYISGHLKIAKPDPRIYELVETDCGIAADALIFADDRPDNIEMAAQRGWQTHLFQSPEGWADRLVEVGLLTESEAA